MRRVIIIGAGIAGAACAHELAERRVESVVVDCGAIAGGASGAAAGIVQPVTGRRANLAPWHAEGFEITTALIDMADAWRSRGVLRLALTADQAGAWSQRSDDWPPRIARWLREGDARQRAAACDDVTVHGAIWIPKGGAADIPTLVRHLLNSSSATVHTHQKVVSTRVEDAGIRVVTAHADTGHEQTLSADGLIIAAGTGTPALLASLGLHYPFREARGELATFRCSAPPPLVLSCGGYVVPLARDRILVGATFDERDPLLGVTEGGVRSLEQRARKLLGVKATLKRLDAWAGVRPASADRVPRAGLLPGCPRVALCAALGAKGLLLGPLAARWTVDELLRGTPDRVPERWRIRSAG